ncbi:MAG: GtrA family protein [Pseudomonadota bacterium]
MRQFINFLGAGAIATAVHYIILLGLVEFFMVAAVPASGAGALAGAFVSYALNRKYTFSTALPHSKSMPRFFAVAALAVISNVLLMKLYVDVLGIPYLLAQIITTIMLIAITFGLNKVWSFRDTPHAEEH